MNEVQINSDYSLYIVGDKKLLSCGIESITNDGEIVVRGTLPQTRLLFVPLSVFVIKDKRGEVVVQAKVLKVNWQEVQDVVPLDAGDVTRVEIVAELLCTIEECEFFEPLTEYPGGVSERKTVDIETNYTGAVWRVE